MRIAILGPGGVGGFLAAALERSGSAVTLIARDETAAVLAQRGLRVRSVALDAEFQASPRVATKLSEPTDVLIIATKAIGLDAALERIERQPALVVPLLNGVEHVAALRERFGTSAIAASIRIESDRPEIGLIEQTSRFLRIELASDDPGPRPLLEPLAESLRAAGVDTALRDSEAQVLWSKLVRLNALACTTSAIDRPIGFIRSDPEWREQLERCVRETVAVGIAEGVRLDADVVMAELDATHDSLMSSMQRDIAAGREPELDAIPGAVLRAAARHGLECPTVAALYDAVAARAGLPRR
ncbi:MAG TPA: ketopantoate reductase family protein [Solirubrobacteraceae bacterium]|nr:ketopantoate reductase family protein [Solirubrobacteraceae bacterium]